MLRAESIVDRKNSAARAVRKLATQHIVRVEIADCPTTAVEEDERRQELCRRGAERAIGAHWNGRVRHLDLQFRT